MRKKEKKRAGQLFFAFVLSRLALGALTVCTSVGS